MNRFLGMALASFWAPLGFAVLAGVAAFALIGAVAVIVGGRRVVARSGEYKRVTRLLEDILRQEGPQRVGRQDEPHLDRPPRIGA